MSPARYRGQAADTLYPVHDGSMAWGARQAYWWK